MAGTDRFGERIGAVHLPEAEVIDTQGFTPHPDDPFPLPDPRILFAKEQRLQVPGCPVTEYPFKQRKFCLISLKQGCYTVSFVPAAKSILGTRFRGTLRVEHTSPGIRMSGDLYSTRLLDMVAMQAPAQLLKAHVRGSHALVSDEAADTGNTIPIYSRQSYRSYLKGTQAELFSIVPESEDCGFRLEFDEFPYTHPTTGFDGSFSDQPSRHIRWVLKETSTPDFYTGSAFEGSTLLGTVSVRWVSTSYRRADLQLHTLQGAQAPPADVDGATIASIFADAGWDLAFADGGSINLPAALAAVDIAACWSKADLHTLMSSVPGYDDDDLDSVWRVHLIAVPVKMDCSRGVMFDSSLGSDPNAVAREGSATFSHDGYPSGEVADGLGGSHYDTAADQEQRNVPRAYLRSATHEVGHAFNQIHQGFEDGNDNSIMTPTPSVAEFLGTGGTFPTQINLAFNATVNKHLRHLPDPAVRPGAMDFFGSAIAAPEAADVAWLDTLELAVEVSADRVYLGELVTLSYNLTNRGAVAVPVPRVLDVESLTVRISVTDPAGKITFVRPHEIQSCPPIDLEELGPGQAVSGSAMLYWGKDGFAFETPGRHLVDVIILWDLAGVPVAAECEREVFVSYPTTDADNEIAALLLDPDVGRAIAVGDVSRFERASERIRRATTAARKHPAIEALRRLGLIKKGRRGQGRRKAR
jgi:hypothetical protein